MLFPCFVFILFYLILLFVEFLIPFLLHFLELFENLYTGLAPIVFIFNMKLAGSSISVDFFANFLNQSVGFPQVVAILDVEAKNCLPVT